MGISGCCAWLQAVAKPIINPVKVIQANRMAASISITPDKGRSRLLKSHAEKLKKLIHEKMF